MLAAAWPMTPDTHRPLSRLRQHDGAADSSTMSLCASSGDNPVRQLLSMPSYLPQDQPDEDTLQQQPLQDDQLLLDDVPSPSPNSGEDAAAVLAALFKQQHHHQQQHAAMPAAAIRVSSSPSTAPGSGSTAAAAGTTGAPRHPVLMQKFPSIGRAGVSSHPSTSNGGHDNGGHGTHAAADAASSMHHSSTTAATASSNGSSSAAGSDPVTPAPQPLLVESAAAPSPASPADDSAAAAAAAAEGGVGAAANGLSHLPESSSSAAAGGGGGSVEALMAGHTQRAPRVSSSSSVSATSLKVSLLSQQLADVQRRTQAIEAAGGASGRGQSLFWQHIHSTAPASRSDSHTAVAAAAAAAAADASRSSGAARSAARHQRQLEEEYQQQYRHTHAPHQQQQQRQRQGWPGASGGTGSHSGRAHQQGSTPQQQQQQQGAASGQQPSPQQQQQQQQQAAGDDQHPEGRGAAAAAAAAAACGSSFRSAGGRLLQPPPAQAPQQQQHTQQQQQQEQQGPGSPERPARPFSRVSSGNGSLLGQVLSLDPHSWEGGQEAPLAREASAAAAAAAGGGGGGLAAGGITPQQQQQQQQQRQQQQQQQGLNGYHPAGEGAAGGLGGSAGWPLSSGSPGGLYPHSLHMLPERFGLLNSPSVKSFLLKHRSQLLPLDSAAAAAAAVAGGGLVLSNGPGLQSQGSGGVSDPQRLTLYMPEPLQQQPPPPPQQQQQQQAAAAGEAPLHPQLYWVGSPELMEPLLGPAHGSRLSLTPLPLGPQLGVGWEPGLGVTLSSPGRHSGVSRSGSRRSGLQGSGAAAGVLVGPSAGGVAAPAGLRDFQELMEQLLEELCCCGQVPSEEAGADLAAACSIHHVCFGGPPVVAGRGWWEVRGEQVRDAWEQWQGRAARRAGQLARLLQQLWHTCAGALGKTLQQAARSSSHLVSGGIGSSSSGILGGGGIGVGVSPLGRHQAPGYRPWR